MKLKNVVVAASLFVSSPFFGSANATTIDFTALPSGTAVTTQYADFSATLSGGNASGSPTIAYYGGGLSNSPTAGKYPTAQFLNIAFTNAVDSLSFMFDNEGFNGNNKWFAYDTGNLLLQSGFLNTHSTISVTNFGSTGVGMISFDNGQARGNWTQALSVLTYNVAPTHVPEPGSMLIIGLGLAGLAAVRRRKSV